MCGLGVSSEAVKELFLKDYIAITESSNRGRNCPTATRAVGRHWLRCVVSGMPRARRICVRAMACRMMLLRSMQQENVHVDEHRPHSGQSRR
jgi:hypothetical protein